VHRAVCLFHVPAFAGSLYSLCQNRNFGRRAIQLTVRAFSVQSFQSCTRDNDRSRNFFRRSPCVYFWRWDKKDQRKCRDSLNDRSGSDWSHRHLMNVLSSYGDQWLALLQRRLPIATCILRRASVFGIRLFVHLFQGSGFVCKKHRLFVVTGPLNSGMWIKHECLFSANLQLLKASIKTVRVTTSTKQHN